MSIQDYAFYRIKNVRSSGEANTEKGHVHLPGASMKSGTAITQWDYDNRGVEFTDHFEFLLIEVEREAAGDQSYYIVNRRSGMCLVIDDTADGAPLKQMQWPPMQDEIPQPMMAQFVLQPVPGFEDRYRIMSQYAGTYLLVETTTDPPDSNGNPLRAFNEYNLPKANMDELEQLYFTLTHVGAAVPLPKLEADADGDTRDQLKRVKRMSDALPRATELVLLEYDTIPFFWVNDPVYPAYRQVAVTPYYTLRRSRLWQKMYDKELDGVVERASTETIRIGMTTVDIQSYRSAFKSSTETKGGGGAKVSFKFFEIGGSGSVAKKLENEVETTIERKLTQEVERTTEDRITYPSVGHPYRIARWRPTDRYELCRADDRAIYNWDVVREDEEVIDVHQPPPQEKESEKNRRRQDR